MAIFAFRLYLKLQASYTKPELIEPLQACDENRNRSCGNPFGIEIVMDLESCSEEFVEVESESDSVKFRIRSRLIRGVCSLKCFEL